MKWSLPILTRKFGIISITKTIISLSPKKIFKSQVFKKIFFYIFLSILNIYLQVKKFKSFYYDKVTNTYLNLSLSIQKNLLVMDSKQILKNVDKEENFDTFLISQHTSPFFVYMLFMLLWIDMKIEGP